MMRLEYRHNNAYDAILLVDTDSNLVRSNWTVTPDVLRDFCDCSQDAADWDDRFGNEHRPDEYGELIAVRNGYALEAINTEKWESRVSYLVH